MAVYYLEHSPLFPNPEEAEPIGLLAMGGDLSVKRLVTAYSKGIFPWYTNETPILWWSPDPRPILEPHKVHVSRSLRRELNKKRFSLTLDRDFYGVITACASSRRPGGDGTWLLPEMIEAYCCLHMAGIAHSVEAWYQEKLVGGLYGVALGKAFFAESMFYKMPNASKVALVQFAKLLESWGYHFIDCQQQSAHVERFGAKGISRKAFLKKLDEALDGTSEESYWPVKKGAKCPDFFSN